jgi:hypothetical protein
MMTRATSGNFRQYQPEVILAEMVGKEFGTLGISPDPEQLRAWIMRHWGVLQSLAHEIHRQDQVRKDPSHVERYLAQIGQ